MIKLENVKKVIKSLDSDKKKLTTIGETERISIGTINIKEL